MSEGVLITLLTAFLGTIAFFLMGLYKEHVNHGKVLVQILTKIAAYEGKIEALEEGKRDFENRLRALELKKI